MFTGKWWAIAGAIIWILLFVWLYIDQNKIPLPSKRYALAGTGVVDDVVDEKGTEVDETKSEWQISDIDGLDFSNVKKAKKKSSKVDNVDAINGMDFTNYSKK